MKAGNGRCHLRQREEGEGQTPEESRCSKTIRGKRWTMGSSHSVVQGQDPQMGD